MKQPAGLRLLKLWLSQVPLATAQPSNQIPRISPGVLSKCPLSSDRVPRPLLLCLPSPWLEPLSSHARCGCAIHLPVRDVPSPKRTTPPSPRRPQNEQRQNMLKHVNVEVLSCSLVTVYHAPCVAAIPVTTTDPFLSKLRIVKSLLPLQAFRTGKSCQGERTGGVRPVPFGDTSQMTIS